MERRGKEKKENGRKGKGEHTDDWKESKVFQFILPYLLFAWIGCLIHNIASQKLKKISIFNNKAIIIIIIRNG